MKKKLEKQHATHKKICSLNLHMHPSWGGAHRETAQDG